MAGINYYNAKFYLKKRSNRLKNRKLKYIQILFIDLNYMIYSKLPYI